MSINLTGGTTLNGGLTFGAIPTPTPTEAFDALVASSLSGERFDLDDLALLGSPTNGDRVDTWEGALGNFDYLADPGVTLKQGIYDDTGDGYVIMGRGYTGVDWLFQLRDAGSSYNAGTDTIGITWGSMMYGFQMDVPAHTYAGTHRPTVNTGSLQNNLAKSSNDTGMTVTYSNGGYDGAFNWTPTNNAASGLNTLTMVHWNSTNVYGYDEYGNENTIGSSLSSSAGNLNLELKAGDVVAALNGAEINRFAVVYKTSTAGFSASEIEVLRDYLKIGTGIA